MCMQWYYSNEVWRDLFKFPAGTKWLWTGALFIQDTNYRLVNFITKKQGLYTRATWYKNNHRLVVLLYTSCAQAQGLSVANIAWTNVTKTLEIVQDGSRKLPLKFCQNRVSNSWDITDIKFSGGGGWWWWCAKSFSCKTQTLVRLGVRLSWGWVGVLTILCNIGQYLTS